MLFLRVYVCECVIGQRLRRLYYCRVIGPQQTLIKET